MSGPYHYLVPLIWDTSLGGGFWRAQDGCVLGLDTRDIPSQGLADTYGDWPTAYQLSETQRTGEQFFLLGAGHVAEVDVQDVAKRSAWLRLLGVDPVGTTLLQWLISLGTDAATVDGSRPMKPLVPTCEGEVELYLPFHSRVYAKPFGLWDPAGNAYHNRIRDLLRLDFSQLKKESKNSTTVLRVAAQELRREGKVGKAEVREAIANEHDKLPGRNITVLCRKYGCTFAEIDADVKPLKPHTTITDSFSGDLSAWTQYSGTWEILSGKLVKSAGWTQASIRHNTSLSSADHYSQGDCVSSLYYRGGPAIRCQSGAETYYFMRIYFGNIYKSIAGTLTSIGSPQAWASGNVTIKIDGKGSAIKCYFDGVEKTSATDTAISTGVLAGFAEEYPDTSTTKDNFEASDGIVAGQPFLKRFGGVPFAGRGQSRGVQVW